MGDPYLRIWNTLRGIDHDADVLCKAPVARFAIESSLLIDISTTVDWL